MLYDFSRKCSMFLKSKDHIYLIIYMAIIENLPQSVKNVIITVFIPKEIPMTETLELRSQRNRTRKCVTDTMPKLKNLVCLRVRLAKSKLI